MRGEWEVLIDSTDYNHRLELRFGRKGEDGGFAVMLPTTMQVVEPAERAPTDPAMGFYYFEGLQFLQAVMNAAWKIGVRPTDDHAKNLDASSRHLEDMRALVAKTLDVKLP